MLNLIRVTSLMLERSKHYQWFCTVGSCCQQQDISTVRSLFVSVVLWTS